MNSTKPVPAAPAATRTANKPVPAATKEKQKSVRHSLIGAFADEAGETVLRSSKGFPIFENEFLTLEEKALLQLARENNGTAVVVAELRIILAHDKPESLDISRIKLVSQKK